MLVFCPVKCSVAHKMELESLGSPPHTQTHANFWTVPTSLILQKTATLRLVFGCKC